ncbi:MAG: hypothetical protein H7099_06805 [Gemmatimonadaceae bacterium]|nr:hypothetical protein [Gemmatimonadaceae bacterium]
MMRRSAVGLVFLLCAGAVHAQGLFRDTMPLDVTIETELKALIRERDSTKFTPHPATLTYRDAAGVSTTFPATLRARGHFRRQARNCEFPPLKLEFARKDARETLFQGNANLKITTNCRPSTSDYQQYILAEYALYRVYQIVSPKYFRTRLARITYHDKARTMNDVVSWAFFIEDDKEVAKKFGAEIDESHGALFRDLEPSQLAITSLFEYMVANTDWSITGLHNIALLRDSTGTISPVAFDFDWSGAVNARYSFPDARLGIRSTTERLYRGPCRTMAEWQPVLDRFIAARPRIEAIYASLPALDARRKRDVLEYFAEFYKIIGDQKSARHALLDGCLPQGN